MRRDIARRLSAIEAPATRGQTKLIVGETQVECDRNWRDYLASRPSQPRPEPLFIATGVPRAADGMVT